MTTSDVLVALGAGVALGAVTIPHCAAMCGPLAAASCAAGGKGARSFAEHQLGRLVSYTALGAIVGGAGSALVSTLPVDVLRAVTSFTMALALAIAAFRAFRSTMERREAPIEIRKKKPFTLSPAMRVVRSVIGRPFLAGLAFALVPCGALVTAGVLAASTVHPLSGAVAMAGFAVASGPGLGVAVWIAGRAKSFGKSGVRALAMVLAMAAVLAVVRPLPLLADARRPGDPPAAQPLPACCRRGAH